MKTKLFLPMLAAVLCSQVAMAQFHVGFRAGANITKIEGKSFKDEFKYGYLLGGFAEIGVSRKFSINPEVLFNQYTGTVSDDYKDIYEGVFNSDQSKVKINYLSIPLVLDYKLLGPIHLQAGPQFSVLMNKDKNFLENGGDAFTKGDLALLGGVQLKLSALRITGRYVVGLNNINDIDNQDKWRSQAFQLTAGFAL
jgi:hypothetical protein